MDGFSSVGFKNAYEKTLKDVSLSKAFNMCIENNYLTPAAYTLNVIRDCNLYKKPEELTYRIVKRAIRTLPSFIREMDLAYKLQLEMKEARCYKGSVEEDITDHTDVFLEYQKKVYRIWSYTYSKDIALDHTVSKISGDRGDLKDGLHLLCPMYLFDSEQYEEIEGWRLHSLQYIKNIHFLIEREDIQDYNAIIKNREDLRKYIKNMHIFRKKDG